MEIGFTQLKPKRSPYEGGIFNNNMQNQYIVLF